MFPQGFNYPPEDVQIEWNTFYYNAIETFPADFDREAHLATIEWRWLERPDVVSRGLANPFGLQLAAYISDEWVWEFMTPETARWTQTARTGQASRGHVYFPFAGHIDYLYYPSRHNFTNWKDVKYRSLKGWFDSTPYYLQRYLFVMTPRTLFGEQVLRKYMCLNVVNGTVPDQVDYLNEQLRLWRQEDEAARSREQWNQQHRRNR